MTEGEVNLRKLILHRGDETVVGKRWKKWSGAESVAKWAEQRLGPLGWGVGFLVKENGFDPVMAVKHLEAGVGGVELDIQGRGEPMVAHPRVMMSVLGLGGRASSEAQPLLEVAERLGEVSGNFALVAHLKTGDYEALSQSVRIFRECGLLAKVFFQTYYLGHLRRVSDIQSGMGLGAGDGAGFIYMGVRWGEAMEILGKSRNQGSRLGIPAAVARLGMARNWLRSSFPGMGLHINLTYDKEIIQEVAKGRLDVDSIMVPYYDFLT